MGTIKPRLGPIPPEIVAGFLFFAGNIFFAVPSVDWMGKTAGALNILSCALALTVGRRVWGYSLTYACGVAGAIFTILSNATGDNLYLQLSLAAQALIQTAASFRYPIRLLQPFLPTRLSAAAEAYEQHIRTVTGTGLIVIKIPTLLSAAFGIVTRGQNFKVFAANLVFAAGDVLFNRLHQRDAVKNVWCRLTKACAP